MEVIAMHHILPSHNCLRSCFMLHFRLHLNYKLGVSEADLFIYVKPVPH